MSYRKVQAALDTRLLEFQSTEIAFPGVPYRPQHGTGYLQVAFLPGPAATVALGPGALQQHSGFYRITVTETSSAALLEKIDGLRAHFPCGLTLTFDGLDIHLDGASAGSPAETLKDLSRPLSVTWRSYF